MKAKDFDHKFDLGVEDFVDDLDMSTSRRVNQTQKRINVDFPARAVDSLDKEDPNNLMNGDTAIGAR